MIEEIEQELALELAQEMSYIYEFKVPTEEELLLEMNRYLVKITDDDLIYEIDMDRVCDLAKNKLASLNTYYEKP